MQTVILMILTFTRNTHNDMDVINIRLAGEYVRQQLWSSQLWSNGCGLLGNKIVDGKRDAPEFQITGINTRQLD